MPWIDQVFLSGTNCFGREENKLNMLNMNNGQDALEWQKVMKTSWNFKIFELVLQINCVQYFPKTWDWEKFVQNWCRYIKQWPKMTLPEELQKWQASRAGQCYSMHPSSRWLARSISTLAMLITSAYVLLLALWTYSAWNDVINFDLVRSMTAMAKTCPECPNYCYYNKVIVRSFDELKIC